MDPEKIPRLIIQCTCEPLPTATPRQKQCLVSVDVLCHSVVKYRVVVNIWRWDVWQLVPQFCGDMW